MTNKAPKEWWVGIELIIYGFKTYIVGQPGETIKPICEAWPGHRSDKENEILDCRFVEYSALEELKKENEELKKEIWRNGLCAECGEVGEKRVENNLPYTVCIPCNRSWSSGIDDNKYMQAKLTSAMDMIDKTEAALEFANGPRANEFVKVSRQALKDLAEWREEGK